MIQIVLKNDGCRRRVETLFADAPILLADRQAAFRLHAGQPFVLENNGQSRNGTKLRGEHLHPRRERRRTAIETMRQANDDCGDAVLFTPKPRDFLGNQMQSAIVHR